MSANAVALRPLGGRGPRELLLVAIGGYAVVHELFDAAHRYRPALVACYVVGTLLIAARFWPMRVLTLAVACATTAQWLAFAPPAAWPWYAHLAVVTAALCVSRELRRHFDEAPATGPLHNLWLRLDPDEATAQRRCVVALAVAVALVMQRAYLSGGRAGAPWSEAVAVALVTLTVLLLLGVRRALTLIALAAGGLLIGLLPELLAAQPAVVVSGRPQVATLLCACAATAAMVAATVGAARAHGH